MATADVDSARVQEGKFVILQSNGGVHRITQMLRGA